MQLHPTSRTRRVRRLITVSAAAVAVMIAPTASDYGGAARLDLPSHAGHTDGMNMDDPQQHEVVPVGNTVTSTPEPSAGAAETTTTSAAATKERRRGDGVRRWRNYRPANATIPPPTGTATATAAPTETGTPSATDSAAPTADPTATASATAPATAAAVPGAVPPGGKDGNNNGLDVLGRDCTASQLPAHTGFQESPACVSTAMGEIAAEDKLPSLLITKAPEAVGVGQAFQLEVSTRNLVRDRFLGAAAGGYYLESSFLNNEGLQRGHFHTACRILPSTTEAPDSSGTPAFFLATQDNGGGAAPDTVTINVPGINTAGELQCTSWAGDGSHRTPMMTRANQTPAIDSVRITVGGDAQPAQDVNQAEAQQDAAAQVEAEQQAEGAQQPDQDGAAPAQQEAAATATDSAAETSANEGADESTATAAEESAEVGADN